MPTSVASWVDLPFRLEVLHEAEVHDLRDVREASPLAQDDVPRLDVAVHEPDAVGLGERLQHLAEDVHDAARRLGAVRRHQLVEAEALEVLHRVVEDAVGRAAVVEDGHGVGVAEPGRELHLALEAPKARLAHPLRLEQLDRRGAPQHGVAGPVDDPHAALAELLLERVLAQLPRVAHLAAQAVDHRRSRGGDGDRGEQPHHLPDREADGLVGQRVDGQGEGGDDAHREGSPRRAGDEDGPRVEDQVHREQHDHPAQVGLGDRAGRHDEDQGPHHQHQQDVEGAQRPLRPRPAPAVEPRPAHEQQDGDERHVRRRGVGGLSRPSQASTRPTA